MLFGPAVNHKPKDQPDKSQRTGEEEGRAPAPMQRDPRHDEGCDDGSGVRAGVEDSRGESALFFGKPFGDALDAGGKNAVFAKSEGEARGREAGEGTRSSMSHGRDAPESHGQRVARTRAETIDEAAHQQHARGVGD